MKKLLTVLLNFLALFVLSAQANDVIFQCTLKGDVEVKLEREAKSDTWIMTRIEPNKKPLVVIKAGNDMGVSSQLHAAENTAINEVYVDTPETFYALGWIDDSKTISGYVQELKNGVQTAYGKCDDKSFHVDTSTPGLFDNLTVVD